MPDPAPAGLPVHGATDAGPPPVWDFSTNANPLGPAPGVRAALAAVDPGPYPDPAHTRAREATGAAEGVPPGQVVVGSGASELIHRLVHTLPGPVAVARRAFGEYAHAARVHGRPLREAEDPDRFLAALDGAGLAFLTVPNNPDGAVPDADWLAEAARRAETRGCRLVLDLAYAPLSQRPVALPPTAWRLHSPTKAHGLTGLRAGYLVAPQGAARELAGRAPSWVLGAHGEALLTAAAEPGARAHVDRCARRLWAWRDQLAEALAGAGVRATPGAANFLLAEVGADDGGAGASEVAARLRERGLRVRDAGSFGLPGHLRLAALGPEATAALLDALPRALRDTRR